jgi:hypothetical protein
MSNDHKVTLTPIQQNGQLVWEMEYKGSTGNGPDSYPKIHVDKGAKNTKIEFTINDPGNITFVPKDQKPIYVQETDPTNPKKPAKGVVNYQFETESVSQDGKTLTIKDKNGSAATYSYDLNFINARSLDPIIENGGGGGSGNFYDFIQNHPIETGIALLLLIVGVIALLRRGAMRSRMNTGGPASS